MTNTDHRFRFEPAFDPAVEDSEYVLIENEDVSIQVHALGGKTIYILNSSGQDDPNDDGTFWIRDHGEFDDLEVAKENAINLAKKLSKQKAEPPQTPPQP